nr:MAG TPA_asm: hypothetical protein [Caudoviricetes sp.]
MAPPPLHLHCTVSPPLCQVLEPKVTMTSQMGTL